MLNLSRDPSDRPPRNAGRRHLDDRQYTADETQFMLAVQRWRERHRGAHPSCRDVLAVAKALGYRKAPVAIVSGPHGSDDAGPDFLSDDDAELLKVVRACPGTTAWHLPPRLRPSLVRLERLRLIRDRGGRWYPVTR